MTYDPIQPFASEGVHRLLEVLNPHGRLSGRVFYPRQFKDISSRIQDSQPIHDWFIGTLEALSDVGSCQVEEDMACFIELEWNQSNLTYVNFHVVISRPQSIGDYSCDPSRTNVLVYFRMDYSRKILGQFFTHPLPHIHIHTHDAPRFHLESMTTGNLVVDFLDFIYRNYYFPQWKDWAKRVCRKRVKLSDGEDRFDRIVEAYKDGKFVELSTDHSEYIRLAKEALREWKDAQFSLRVEQEACSLLSY